MPALNWILSLPEDIKSKINNLDDDYKDEEITLKGYCRKKWDLLKEHASIGVTSLIEDLQSDIENKKINEKEAYKKMYEILNIEDDTKSIDKVEKNVLKSVENIMEIDPVPGTSSKPVQKSKITDFFQKNNKTEIKNEIKDIENKNGEVNKRKSLTNHENGEKKIKSEEPDENDRDVKRKNTIDHEESEKKIKNEDSDETVSNTNVTLNNNSVVKNERCKICKQFLSSAKFYNGHPNGAVDEFIALTDPKLMLFTGEENGIDDYDARPQNKITYFSVYDKEGHLCPFDSGLIESNKLLYFSGYVKPIYEENVDTEGGIPTKDLGPINEWWVSGFDGGEKALLGFSTGYGEYYLMEPSDEYSTFMTLVKEKIYLSKLVIEFLLLEGFNNPSYEDLLNHIQTIVPPEYIESLSEETLLRHAQFVCDQVTSFDSKAGEDDTMLITTPCMRSLVKLAGVTFGKRRAMRKSEHNLKKKPMKWSQATTTALVQEVFESFFPEQLDKTKDHTIRRKRCGVCEACQLPDCGQCSKCLDMAKFGGSGRSKQACVQRRCPNMAIQDADDSDSEEKENDDTNKIEHSKPLHVAKRVINEVTWITEPTVTHAGRTYYKEVQIGDTVIKPGDYVMLHANEPGVPLLIAKVAYMWDESLQGKMFHAHLFCRGTDTVIGETADPRELFVVDECENCPLGSIVRKAEVELRIPDKNWRFNGGLDHLPPSLEDDGKTFFYQKRYDRELSRFEDLIPEPEGKTDYKPCSSCRRICDKKNKEKPKLINDTVQWRNETYKTGSAVYLHPNTFEFISTTTPTTKSTKKETIDEEIYPEFYRKTSDNIKGSNNETAEPFNIGYILEIFTKSKDPSKLNPNEIKLKILKMYRPENTHKGVTLSQQLDLNLVYWSEEEVVVNFSQVIGKCYVIFSENLDITPQEWSKSGPNRFYFTQMYDSKKKEFLQVDNLGFSIGRMGKGKGAGKGKSKKAAVSNVDLPELWPETDEPLKIMDVFAGCGGLSEGLHQSGVGETMWAIEQEESAAHAFKLNNPKTIVYSEDCNHLLTLALSGAKQTDKGLTLPTRGDVDLLCGGPPCQGFSGMNRFNAGQYSLFKNSLIVSYLSYCDFYRPKYFILENVRNFVSFKRSMVLKLTLRCLLAMGYQCTFGVLQAGNYGVPQTRRRLIILAAAPGEVLPEYPDPIHVFNKRGMQLNVVVDDCKYTTGTKWFDSAPYRTITVRDAMSDLPEIRNGTNIQERSYDSEPLSHFQRLMRGVDDQPLLRDHICKEMAPLVEARMSHIPTASGSDWRDLPNIIVRLTDGTYTNKLIYTHHDKKNGKSSKGALRGVCSCASSKSCDPMDRQFNTLIPWCLPHTGNRHNHWAGLYGRLEWDGFFSTTVTNPEPMGKQGRVLHPVQNRVVSVRECARSQGFPDKYRFYGNILDKHRQVGNAVPPPMGAALGRQIKKAIAKKEQNIKIEENIKTEDCKISTKKEENIETSTEKNMEISTKNEVMDETDD